MTTGGVYKVIPSIQILAGNQKGSLVTWLRTGTGTVPLALTAGQNVPWTSTKVTIPQGDEFVFTTEFLVTMNALETLQVWSE